MANIFKTTLKKDIIADIANNNIREIRFPITKFWATRLADKYSLDEKTFEFKTFDTLELSSPSNKDTDTMTYVFGFSKTYVDNDEFVVCFYDIIDVEYSEVHITDTQDSEDDNIDVLESLDFKQIEDCDSDLFYDYTEYCDSDLFCDYDEYDEEDVEEDYTPYVSNDEVLDFFNKWLNEENILEYFYEDENVFATKARQVIVLPNGKLLGFKKTLPVNNDVEVRIEFDNNKKIYFDEFQNSDSFKEYVLKTLSEIRKNNFVFVWKIYTGIFVDSNDRVYFGIKYSTRKSIGFNRKYNVQ
jgi:hypothetical protein